MRVVRDVDRAGVGQAAPARASRPLRETRPDARVLDGAAATRRVSPESPRAHAAPRGPGYAGAHGFRRRHAFRAPPPRRPGGGSAPAAGAGSAPAAGTGSVPAAGDPSGAAPGVTPAAGGGVEERFRTGEVATIAGAHFVHDTFTAFVAPLLPLLQQRLGTNYAMTGGLAVFLQLPSLLNPLIGYLADKVSLRYFVILAPAVTATLITLLGRAPGYLSLALLLLAAGVSVASFHAPAPPMVAHVAGRRVGAGMSIFMAGGELGRSLGPVLAVAAVGWFGLEGLWRLAFVGWAVSFVLYLRLRNVSAEGASKRAGLLPWGVARRVFPAIALLVAARMMLVVSATTYLPLFMKDVVGSGLWLGGAALTILEAAGVVGALAAGTLSDRLGRGTVLLTVSVAAPLVMLAFLYAPAVLALPLLVLLGLSALASAPVLLAAVQDVFPDNRALGNGTFLALNFLIRAGGIYTVGALADGLGLERAYLVAALVAFLAIPAVPLLVRRSLRPAA